MESVIMNKMLAPVMLALFVLTQSVMADDVMTVGGDTFLSGSSATLSVPSPRDALLMGFSVNLASRVEKDADLTGFNVNVNAPVGKDLSASGFSVEVTQPIGEDITATGFSVHLGELAKISGNARLTGGNVIVDGPIEGSLAAAGGTISINNTIMGDALLTLGTINFGKDAKILGSLTYYAAEPKSIPASVIAADHVQFKKIDVNDASKVTTDFTENAAKRVWPTYLSATMVLLLIVGFLVATAAVLFAFAPHKMNTWTSDAIASPVKSMSLGILGLSASIGLVPVSAMTLIGIPLVPIAFLLAFVFWIIGYLIGVFAISVRIVGAFRVVPSTAGGKLLLLTLAIVVAIMLNFIPIIGWLINLALVFLGLGSIVLAGARNVTHQYQSSPLTPSAETTVSQERTVRAKKK
jgi:hypothetical protein